jgi:hypothetical protein
MESLSFFLKQFLVSFLAGCIMNIYMIISYFILKSVDIFPMPHFPQRINFTFIFIIVALIIGVIFEGILQACVERKYLGGKGTSKFWRFFIESPTIYQVCKNIFDKNEENPIKRFIEDSKINYTSAKGFYHTELRCANIVEKNGFNVCRFRDISFILQLMRWPFYCIFLISLIPGIAFAVKLYGTDKFNHFVWFISLSIIISLASIFILPALSRAAGKRHLYDVGRAYDALKFDLSIHSPNALSDSADGSDKQVAPRPQVSPPAT